MLREHPVLPLGSAHLLQLVEGRAAARLLRGQGGEAAPQRRSVCCKPVQHSGLCCLVSSLLVVCAVFARRLWRCTASRGEWRAARAAPRVARTAPESALDEPAGAARAPCKLAHRLHAAVVLWLTAVNLVVVNQNRRAL